MIALVREIGELQVKLSGQQYQIAALETISASFENLADVCSEALTSMEGTVHHWDDVVNNLAAARELVKQPDVDLSVITAFKELPAAAKNWATIAERAKNIQNSVLKVTEPIVVGQVQHDGQRRAHRRTPFAQFDVAPMATAAKPSSQTEVHSWTTWLPCAIPDG